MPLSARRPDARRAHRRRQGRGGLPENTRRAAMTSLVVAQDLKQTYEIKRGWLSAPVQLHAVGGVSFVLAAGRTLAVVGESGCGKSTLARMVTLIEKPTTGALTLDGVDAVDPPASAVKSLRRTVQIVFQNPYGSLNPRK